MVATMYGGKKVKVAAAKQHQRGVVVAVKQKRSTKDGNKINYFYHVPRSAYSTANNHIE
jgi:hypothetical protein